MRRPVAFAVVVLLAALGDFVASPPAAEAVAAGACSISGTIVFTPSTAGADHGAWVIGPAVISCRGPFRFPHPEQMNGVPGWFSGVGSYTTVPVGPSHCLRELGTGTVDYWIKTEEQDVHMKEAHEFLLAGAGLFTTPTLRGTFEVALHEGNCLTGPVNRATFLAQVTVVRVPR
ncbi:MAG: hypothetical protein LC792_27545, partial [Actinobacteria bacterium]|nr:hypothetical protein [Actinomycetota bacterium]